MSTKKVASSNPEDFEWQRHRDDSNDATGTVIQVLCIPLHEKKLGVVPVNRQSYHVLDDSKVTSIIFKADDNIHGGQQCFACDGIPSSPTTAQVASFESPP